MNRDVKRMIVSISLVALTTSSATLVWAGTDSTTDLKPMPINAPVLISAGEGWQGHWAKQDLDELLASGNIQFEVLVDAANPNDSMPLSAVADVLTCLYGAGGEKGDALDQAVKLGLIRQSDFAEEQIRPDQPVSREQFALLLTRALGINGAEDPVTGDITVNYVDGAEIQAKYRGAAAILQAEGLMVGDGQGHFSPAKPVTYAQAARTATKVSAWTRAKVAKIAGLNIADATYLINNEKVTLAGGVAEKPAAPDSAIKAVTKLSDRLAAGDIDGDHQIDVAAVLTQNNGGSGTFYYLAALQHDGTPVASAFLGDRIAVQKVRVVDGKVVVDMLTRGASDAMAVRPYIKETRVFEVKDGALVPFESILDQVTKAAGLNPAEATYLIGKDKVTLAGGVAEKPVAPDSAAKAVTKLSDRMAAGDLNGDEQIDVAAVLTHNGGGSGTFYYLAGVMHDGTPVTAAFLGDRIAVENVKIADGKVTVDMLTRGADDAMAVRPSIKETRVFEVKDGALVPFESAADEIAKIAGFNPADATYLIGNEKVTLADGVAEKPVAPDSAAKAVTKLSDRMAAGDLNGDEQIDVAAVLTHNGGGSGTFYYLAGVMHDGTPVTAAFLGDRIAVENVKIADGKVTVDMLTRGANDPMAVQPSIKETRVFELKDGALVPFGSAADEIAKIAGFNPADATYLIGNEKVTLADGVAEKPVAPDSAAKAVTKLSDRMAAGDLNGDEQIDVAAVLTHNGGGSGTFYYLTAVLHDGTPVTAAFLGDRIAVENVKIADGKVTVDMLTRSASDAMSVQPSIKETRVFEVKDGALVPFESILEQVTKLAGFNPADATYLIDNQKVTLADGVAEKPVAPDSAAKAVTKLSDRMAAGDLNGDQQIDVAAVLTHNGGGSGTFYYLTAVLHDGTPVTAAFLGDRIAVENVKIADGKVTVDMLTRGANDPMAVQPSIKETRVFELKDGTLVPLAS